MKKMHYLIPAALLAAVPLLFALADLIGPFAPEPSSPTQTRTDADTGFPAAYRPQSASLTANPETNVDYGGDGIDYVVWIDENARSRGLLLDCSLDTPLDRADIAAMARTIYGDIRGDGFSQVTIAWHVRNRTQGETPYAVSYMTSGRTAHRLMQ